LLLAATNGQRRATRRRPRAYHGPREDGARHVRHCCWPRPRPPHAAKREVQVDGSDTAHMVLALREDGLHHVARPALSRALAARAAAGRRGHSGWDSAALPETEPLSGVQDLPSPVRLPNLLKTKLKRALQEAYALCDADGDGEVSIAECVELGAQMAEASGGTFDAKEARQRFHAMDRNDDGTVSVHEYVEFSMRDVKAVEFERETQVRYGCH
jgi:hypothetical protein